MVAGFVEASAGRIVMGGRDVTSVPPYRRNTGMVFQSYALFPHKTVAANVAFGLKVRGVSRGETAERTREALRLVRLEPLADRYPAELSGGQKQRVALARAVVIRPQVLLLDEPLGALDLKLREELQVEIKRVQSALGITHSVRHPRSGRGARHVGPSGGHARGRDRADRHAAGTVRKSRTAATSRISSAAPTCSRSPCAVAIRAADTWSILRDGWCDIRSCECSACRLRARRALPAGGASESFSVGGDQPNRTDARVLDVTYRGSSWSVDLAGRRDELFTALVHPGTPLPARGRT